MSLQTIQPMPQWCLYGLLSLIRQAILLLCADLCVILQWKSKQIDNDIKLNKTY